jgi:hypothetical protein
MISNCSFKKRKNMKAVLILMSLVIPVVLSAQYSTGSLDLKVSGYTTFNDSFNYLNSAGDTLMETFKTGKGIYTQYDVSYLFEENYKGQRVGIFVSHIRGQEGFHLNLCSDVLGHHYRAGVYNKTKLGLILADSKTLSNGDLYTKISLTHQKDSYNYIYEEVDSYLEFEEESSRVGGSLELGSTFGRLKPYAKWFKKTEISAFCETYHEIDIDKSRLAYGGDINFNIFSILGEQDFYLSPNIGVSVKEHPVYSLGLSPIISVGFNVSSTWTKKDLLKISYQRKIYTQSSVPYTGIDGVYFSFNIGAFLWK